MNDPNTAIYSCYYGPDSDSTFAQIEYKGFDCYFVTNNISIADKARKKNWNIIFDDIEISDSNIVNAFNSKKVKCKPQTFKDLLRYKYLIYLDDKKIINPKKVIEYGLRSLNKEGSIALRLHPANYSNIWCEFGMALLQERYRVNKTIVYDYINKMLTLDYNENDNIYWTSLIFRDMSHPETMIINEQWYNEVNRCGIECQISFFFIAQKYLSIKVLPNKGLEKSNFFLRILKKIHKKLKYHIFKRF